MLTFKSLKREKNVENKWMMWLNKNVITINATPLAFRYVYIKRLINCRLLIKDFVK